MVMHKAILAKKVASYESQSNVNDRIKDACVSSSARAFVQAGSDCVACHSKYTMLYEQFNKCFIGYWLSCETQCSETAYAHILKGECLY
eukprot:scaffold95216_cov68-Attheya_sp.AAC.7